jgi:hypothetical protein
MLTLPATLERVLSKVEAGQIEVRLAEEGRNGTTRGRAGRGARSSAQRGPSALPPIVLGTASLASGVALMVNQDVIAGWFCLGLAGLAVLGLVLRR